MKLKAKHMPIVITATLALSFLLTLFVIAVSNARDISAQMLPLMEQQFEDMVEEIKEESELLSQGNYSAETKKSHMQILMADYTDSTSLPYPIRCYSNIRGNNGDWYCNSQNAVILSRMVDGTEESIPLYFLEDDMADIPNVLTYPYSPDKSPLVLKTDKVAGYHTTNNDVLEFAVFSLGSKNYIASIEKDWKDVSGGTTYYRLHEHEVDSDELTYHVAAARFDHEPVENLTFTTCVKSFGGTKFFDSNYTKGWKKTDRLSQDLRIDLNAINQSLPNPGIFTTRFSGTRTIYDAADLVEKEDYIRFFYAAEFSPFVIALRFVFQPDILLPILVIFAAAWVAMMSLYVSTRKEELSALRDEISRQQKALSFAKDAEESRREMTSAIAHELKTPIAVLSSYAEAARENIDPGKQPYYLDIISQQAQKMDGMVLELLDLSRLEAGKYKLRRENFDMKELAEDIIEPLMPEIEEKKLSLTWQVTDPIVNADRYRMGQIVENFMTNAIRHTPEGGRIIIRIGTSTETFSVENQGNSIPRDKLKKVWETFYQGDASRNSRGSGLGLSICRSIIALHGGSCKAENTALGVKFSVSLDAGNAPYLSSIVHHEEIIELTYPIAQEYTTVENLMRNLGLIKKQDLPGEVKAGNIKVGEEIIASLKQKLYPGNVLTWQEFKIRILLQDDDKRQAMLMELMKGERGLGSPHRASGFITPKL